MSNEDVPPFPEGMQFVEDYGPKINPEEYEPHEMKLAWKYVRPDDVVLELGARVGVVSCTIAKRLANHRNLVAVEPDQRAIYPLQKNMKRNNCNFQIYPGFISRQPLSLKDHHIWTHSFYDPTSIMDRCTLEELQETTDCKFNVLIADCEGFLGTFYQENTWFFPQLRMIIFERDAPDRCDYDTFEASLRAIGFRCVEKGFNSVWMKESSIQN